MKPAEEVWREINRRWGCYQHWRTAMEPVEEVWREINRRWENEALRDLVIEAIEQARREGAEEMRERTSNYDYYTRIGGERDQLQAQAARLQAERDKLRERVKELEAVFGHRHIARQYPDEGGNPDACESCGFDLRDKIHYRIGLETKDA